MGVRPNDVPATLIPPTAPSAAPFRALRLGGSLTARFVPQADGSLRVQSAEPLLPY